MENIAIDNNAWASLTPEEKKRALYERQKKLLEDFLERNTISRAQYDKSLHDLTEKMGYQNTREGQNLCGAEAT